MIQARLLLDDQGAIRSFEASGHAGKGSRGFDLVCAAFTILARTAVRTIRDVEGATVEGSASEPGSMSWKVLEGGGERIVGISDFLLTGLGDLALEYPDAIELIVEHDVED